MTWTFVEVKPPLRRRNRGQLRKAHLPERMLVREAEAPNLNRTPPECVKTGCRPRPIDDEAEFEALVEALHKPHGSVAKTAAAIGVNRARAHCVRVANPQLCDRGEVINRRIGRFMVALACLTSACSLDLDKLRSTKSPGGESDDGGSDGSAMGDNRDTGGDDQLGTGDAAEDSLPEDGLDGEMETGVDANMDANEVVDTRPGVQTAALTGSTGTALGGNPAGGTAYQDACPAGQAVIGFSGTATVATAGMSVLPRQIATRCGVIQISGTTVTVTPGAMLPTHGMMAPTPWTRTCPENQVIVGFSGRSSTYVDQLVFRCAPLTAASAAPGTALTPGTAVLLPLIGGDGGTPFEPIACPADQVASGSLVRASDYLDAMSLICSRATR